MLFIYSALQVHGEKKQGRREKRAERTKSKDEDAAGSIPTEGTEKREEREERRIALTFLRSLTCLTSTDLRDLSFKFSDSQIRDF